MHLIYVLYLSVAYFRHLLFSCCSATFQASADVSSFSCTGKAYLLAFDSFPYPHLNLYSFIMSLFLRPVAK